MFTVDVISDPAARLQPEKPFWECDLNALTDYDTSIVKPALLFADRVNLISFRHDMQAVISANAYANTSMPMRLFLGFIQLSRRRDPRELKVLGMLEGELCPDADCIAVFSAIDDDETERAYELISDLVDRYAHQIASYQQKYAALLRARRDSLASDDLQRAVDQGILDCVPWHIDIPGPEQLNWTFQDFLPRTVEGVLERLARPSGVPLIEPGAHYLLNSGLEENSRIGRSEKRITSPAGITSIITSKLPGLAQLKVDEILDLRRDLEPYLPAFRSEMIHLSDKISNEPSRTSEESAQRVETYWHRDISPILQDIRQEVLRSTYPRHLLSALSSDKSAIVSASSSIVLATGSVFAGASALAPALAAAAFPFVKALNDAAKARDDVRQNRLYFLYAASDGIKRKTRKRRR